MLAGRSKLDASRSMPQPAGPSEERKRVLVIDDSPSQVLLTTRLLQRAGFVVTSASDGIRGIDQAGVELPDVIVSDVLMPELNGYQVCRLLKDDPATAGIPVILLTALEERIDRFWAEEAGADGFVSKAQLMTELVASVQRASAARPRTNPANATPSQAGEQPLEVHSRLAQLLERMLQEQTVTDRFRRIGVECASSPAAARSLFHSLAMLLDVQVGVLSLPLAAGECHFASCSVAEDLQLALLRERIERAPDAALIAVGDAPGGSGEGVLWTSELRHGQLACGRLSLLLARAPNKQHLRMLELIRRELGPVLAGIIARERQAALHDQLVAAHGQTEHFLSSLSSVLVGVDAAGRIVRWNTAAADAFGIAVGEALGREWKHSGIRWSDPSCAERLARRPADGERAHNLDLGFLGGDGQSRLLAATMDFDSSGGFALLGTDVTARRRMESDLQDAQRLRGIGQLAAGLAHEMNTPGQFISDNLSFLADAMRDLDAVLELCRQLTDPSTSSDPSKLEERVTQLQALAKAVDLDFLAQEMPAALTQTREGAARMIEVVAAMKDFASDAGSGVLAVDVNEAVRNTTVVARKLWHEVADLELKLAEGLPQIHAAPGDLRQALLNLLVNAAEAIGRAGLATRGRLRVTTSLADGCVRIEVSDNGPGLADGVRERVFEPFFTTKPPGAGLGQGLSFAYSAIVKRGGGRLTAENLSEGGARFVIELPLRPQTLTAA